MQIFDSDGTCAGCSQPGSNRLGDHAVSCASQGERIAWHNYLRDALYNTAVSAHLAPLKEERALLPGGVRPADVLLPNLLLEGTTWLWMYVLSLVYRHSLWIKLQLSLVLLCSTDTSRNGINMGRHVWLRASPSSHSPLWY